jgi:hypothetical protein
LPDGRRLNTDPAHPSRHQGTFLTQPCSRTRCRRRADQCLRFRTNCGSCWATSLLGQPPVAALDTHLDYKALGRSSGRGRSPRLFLPRHLAVLNDRQPARIRSDEAPSSARLYWRKADTPGVKLAREATTSSGAENGGPNVPHGARLSRPGLDTYANKRFFRALTAFLLALKGRQDVVRETDYIDVVEFLSFRAMYRH